MTLCLWYVGSKCVASDKRPDQVRYETYVKTYYSHKFLQNVNDNSGTKMGTWTSYVTFFLKYKHHSLLTHCKYIPKISRDIFLGQVRSLRDLRLEASQQYQNVWVPFLSETDSFFATAWQLFIFNPFNVMPSVCSSCTCRLVCGIMIWGGVRRVKGLFCIMFFNWRYSKRHLHEIL